MNISNEEAQSALEWFDVLRDEEPDFLLRKDYEFAAKLYVVVGLKVPRGVQKYLDESKPGKIDKGVDNG